MKKNLNFLFATLMIMALTHGAISQPFLINYFPGTTFFGTYGVTVAGAGSYTSGGALTCLAPTADQYWIGPGGIGDYLYTMSKPIYQVTIHAWGINGGALGAGEYMSMFVNGAPYPLTAANMITYTECSPGGGPCYLWTGELMGPVGTSSDYNGADFQITNCTGITSFECYTDGILSGVAYSVYLDTVQPLTCVLATSNSPCVNDTLYLNFTGDTTTADYLWVGPGGFTSTLKDPFIYPATLADSGVYTLVWTVGTVSDTSRTDVVIHPLPVVDVTSSIPLCSPMTDTLDLAVNPDSTGETFSWTGPNGFTSSLEFPVIYGFDSTDTGYYMVQAVSQYGCINTGSVYVFPGPNPGFTFTVHYGCSFDTVYFTNTTVNATTYSWNFGDGTPTDANRNPYHVYSSMAVFNVTLSVNNQHCDSSITIPVDVRHTVSTLFSPIPDTFCAGQSTTFMDSSYSTLGYGFRPLYSSIWSFGDGTTGNTYQPSHTYIYPGVYPVTLVVTDSIKCEDSMTKNVYVLQLSLASFNDTTLCLTNPLPLTNVLSVIPDITLSYTFQWSPGSNLSDSTVQIPSYSGLGLTTYTLTASVIPFGCAVTDTIRIHSVMGKVLADVTPTTTIPYGSSIQLNADSEVIYWWKPNDGSLNNPDINNPIATPTNSTLYTVYAYDADGCLDSAYVDILVDSTMEEGIPGAFTPNNDGRDDYFKPIGPKFEKLIDFRIYNRWGQQVYYSNNSNDKGWDGTFNGTPQDTGDYFYSITVAMPGGDGQNVNYKGEVVLVR